MDPKDMHPATLAAQAGGVIDMQSGGIVPPIQPSTTYARDRDYAQINPDNMYLRYHNDAVRHAEKVLAGLEGGAEALLFPSGMAAIAALFRSVPNRGRVVVQSGIYWGTTQWVRGFCARREIDLCEVEASDAAALARACAAAPAQLVFVETPSNPWMKSVDIGAASKAAHDAGALLVVDSTAATPVLSQPLSLGADMVMHSATKAINGHSDVLGGVLVAREPGPVWEMIGDERGGAGAVMGPFEAWLLLRGMRTLPLRVAQMCANAMAVATFLNDHPAVETVLYPGLPGHPCHALAARQMSGGFGFLMSIVVRGGRAPALRVAGRLTLFHRATSLGGVESLVEHRPTLEPQSGLPEGMLRLSVGIEDQRDLIADLAQALGQ